MEYNDIIINLFTLTNSHGMTAEITNLGGRVVSLVVPDKNGILRDVVLGFEKVEEYLPENHLSDFGAAIGRYANRLNKGQITIDGRTYQLPQNDGENCLHGGPDGWQYRMFNVESVSDSRLVLSLISEDGDSGFPGDVCARVTYTLTDDNALDIQYEAVTDEPTVINMTNHSYFNLNGDASTAIRLSGRPLSPRANWLLWMALRWISGRRNQLVATLPPTSSSCASVAVTTTTGY